MNWDIVGIKAKVLSKSETERVYVHFMNKELTKCDSVVTNETDAINVTVWETLVNEVQAWEIFAL